jgi:hypothetical protein
MERLLRTRALSSAPLERLPIAPGQPQACLLAAGDLLLSRARSLDPVAVFADARQVWEGADARVGNLESVCTGRKDPAGTIGSSVRAGPEAAEFLGEAQLTAVTVANNHALDYGSEALAESVERVAAQGIHVCGLSPEPGLPARPAVFEVRGVRVGMLGYSDNYRPPAFEAVHAAPAMTNPEEMAAAVAGLARNVDLVIIQLHWGYEFSLHPLRSHREVARRLAAAGAHLVLCHHAHVPMGVEVTGRSLIAHGLGNCLFPPSENQRSGHDWTGLSFLLRIAFSRHGAHSAEFIPYELLPGPSLHLLGGGPRRRFLRALGHMSARLDDSAWLDRLERARIIYETSCIVDLVCRAADQQLVERARLLRTPLHRDLIGALRAIDTAPARLAARFLDGLSETTELAALRRILAERQPRLLGEALPALQKLYRWQDALASRLP